MNGKKIKEKGITNSETIKKLWEEYLNNTRNWQYLLRNIFIFNGRKINRCKKFSITCYCNIRNKIYFIRKHFKSRFIIYCFIYTPFNILRLIIGIFVYNDNNKFKQIS